MSSEKGKITRTEGCYLSDAEICRRNGWRKGTRLSGVECGRREHIRITAVGREDVLAFWEEDGSESLTSLTCRNWRLDPKRKRARGEEPAGGAE